MCAGASYADGELFDLVSLVRAHSTYQTQVLSVDSTGAAPRAIMVKAIEDVGLGNRLPSIATAYVIALFTKRLLLVESTAVLQHIELPFPADWHQHKRRYSQFEDCRTLSHSHVAELHQCDQHSINSTNSTAAGSALADAVLLKYRSIDYDMPLLQTNHQMQHLFTKFFPDGEVFHAVAKYLFTPGGVVTAAMQPHLQQADDCAVGLQMRHHKPFGEQVVEAEHFAGIARMLVRPHAGTIFLASDSDVFDSMQQLLGPQLWWSNFTSTSVLSTHNSAGNPGTELSAFVDMFTLTKCKAIVVTPASSFGYVAAGIAGVKPVYATYGRHEVPFINTWFWQTVTSEPCMFKASRSYQFGGEMKARLKASYRLYFHQTQCHW